jgi:cyclophilin family peptidyl-prolyl cis-trans isomerase
MRRNEQMFLRTDEAFPSPSMVTGSPMRTCESSRTHDVYSSHYTQYSKLRHAGPGTLSMANAGKDTNGRRICFISFKYL